MNRTSLVEHERGCYGCPLVGQADACPVDHPKWPEDGRTITMATAKGARLRYQLERTSEPYKILYKSRTAERFNSQAPDLGIERPALRNGLAIAHQNTLIYAVINLHTRERLRQRVRERAKVAP